VLRLVEIKLKKAGFEVLTARNGEEGLETAVNERPDVVLMDVMMPKMDGFTAASKIKEQMDPAPIVLMLTAKGQESDVVKGLTGGADDYIIKPFAPRELIARINVALIKAGKPAVAVQEE
jgi:DNA-binding response OmpR family regulator